MVELALVEKLVLSSWALVCESRAREPEGSVQAGERGALGCQAALSLDQPW